MESFEQQMLNEIDRCCKTYLTSNSSISVHYECKKEENLSGNDSIPKLEVAKVSYIFD